MNRVGFLKCLSSAAVITTGVTQSLADDASLEEPNFVFILADDMGWNGTSFMAHPNIKESKSDYYLTPNLEKLAAEGMRFSHAYAPAPMCTPSRASFITGKSPAQLHITTPGPSRKKTQDWQKLKTPVHISEFPEKEITIAELLKEKGYASAHFGKWHLNGGGPGKHGFAVHDGETGNKGPGDNNDPNPKDIFGITKRAIAFMNKQVSAKKPFYLHLAHYAVHSPDKALAKSVAKFEKRKKGKYHSDPVFAAMTKDFDTGVGMILKELDKLGIRNNTYVVFMSDNGGGGKGRGRNGNRPLAGGKGSLLEGGIRSPMIIRGPNIKPGTFCDANVIGYDLLPTFCELAGVKSSIPDTVEGTSIVPLLLGKSDRQSFKRKYDELIFHYPHYGKGPAQTPQSAMITGDYKIIKYYETDQIKMFDLNKDIAEKVDLSKSQPEKAVKLQKRMNEYLTRIKAQIPSKNPDYDPKAERTTEKQGGSSRFATMDKNSDGKVAKDEFSGPARRFDRLDKNRDGSLSKDELPSGPGRKKK